MGDLTGGRNIAEYDWLVLFTAACSLRCETDDECDCIDPRLHAPHPDTTQEWDDWDGDPVDGRTACGRRGRMTIPGLGARMGDDRCPDCCRVAGLPLGKGSPKNDYECRKLLGMPVGTSHGGDE